MSAPQNYGNHSRFDPKFHFFLVPVFIANIVIVIQLAIHNWPENEFLLIWEIVFAVALFLLLGAARSYSLSVQDRVIRLEEKLRYEKVLSPELLERSAILTMRQVIALRFASDAELSSLVERALTEGLSGKQIKEAIQNWRADYQRV